MGTAGIIAFYYIRRYWFYGSYMANLHDAKTEQEHIEMAYH